MPGASWIWNGSEGVKRRKAHGKRSTHRQRSARDVHRTKRMFIAALLAIIVLLVLAYKGGRWLEMLNAAPEARGDYQLRQLYQNTIEVDGVEYCLRDDVSAILVLGIDQDSDAAAMGYRNGGQADFIELEVIDDAAERITRLQIDRDTMTSITVLGVLGDVSGERVAQICLAHSFGDGGQQSCELTVDAVSDLLMGVPINGYMSMDLDGISVLNDAVGGVEVTLKDDFSALDPAMTQGTTLTLVGDQAEIFVRSRMSVGDGTNAARMARQQEYMSQLTGKLNERIQQDQDFIGALYDELSEYITTDISRGRLINLVWGSKDYERAQLELAGEHQIGSNGYMQFYADETGLQQTVLELFYQKVE